LPPGERPDGADGAWRVRLARQSRGVSLQSEDGYAVRFGGGLGYGATVRTALAAAVKPVRDRLVGAAR
jgi:hypothetical protein